MGPPNPQATRTRVPYLEVSRDDRLELVHRPQAGTERARRCACGRDVLRLQQVELLLLKPDEVLCGVCCLPAITGRMKHKQLLRRTPATRYTVNSNGEALIRCKQFPFCARHSVRVKLRTW